MRPRIFITQPIAESALERLRSVADVEMNPDSSSILSKAKLRAAARKCDIVFSLLHDKVDADIFAANPKLRALTSMAITPDNIDIATATKMKIPVTVIPPIVGEATADIAFGLVLAVGRRMIEGDQLLREGIFPGAQSNYLAGAGVWSKTIGLVGGKGRIGQATARRARGFGMKVLYSGPRRLEESAERQLEMTYVPLEQLLAESDFVSLHPPLNADTRHLMSDRQFRLMKPSAFIVNTARGAIIDEAALVRALKEKRIAGAGLDVFENEPKPDRALMRMKNVVMLPHLGSAVVSLRDTMANIVVDNVMAILDGRKPPNCVNPEVLSD